MFAPAQETKARSGVPAKTTSAGASSVSRVATIRIPSRSTTLIESEIWFTTQTSFAVWKRTETGSRPTGTAPIETGVPELTSNHSSRASGRLHTANRLPSGLKATGCTGAVSKLMKAFVDAADAVIGKPAPIATNIVAMNSALLIIVWARDDLAVAMPEILIRFVCAAFRRKPHARVRSTAWLSRILLEGTRVETERLTAHPFLVSRASFRWNA